MADALETLLEALLYEGYALYPYTAGAAKNATPTPFGIVYPPRYAAGAASTYDHLELRCIVQAPPEAVLRAEVCFLAAVGARHRATPRRVQMPAATLGDLMAAPVRMSVPSAADDGTPLLIGLRLLSQAHEDGSVEVSLRVENRTPCPAGLDRAQALRRSLISTHPLLRLHGGRFVSPLERPCESVNTFPVLATDVDDAILGAAIILPDHPRIAPESRGDLFDATEIEEALLLHVRTLSDGERAAIEHEDPAVAAMVAHAAAATPSEIVALHGRITIRDVREEVRDRHSAEPPRAPPGLDDPSAGEEQARVNGVLLRRGGRVRILPGEDADLHARLLRGRTATVERIFTDFDGRTHLGVTIDGDPGQELMRETNRLLFFFAGEVEVVAR